MAQPSAWIPCCWCRIGLICERFPPAAETLGFNARRFSRQLEEMDAQLAVLEDQMAIANTIPRDQIVAHRRRAGENPRVKAPPPELLVRANDGPR